MNSTIKQEMKVFYHLLPKDKPTNPEKLWLGKVVRYYGGDYLLVELLEPGYESLIEVISRGQVQQYCEVGQ